MPVVLADQELLEEHDVAVALPGGVRRDVGDGHPGVGPGDGVELGAGEQACTRVRGRGPVSVCASASPACQRAAPAGNMGGTVARSAAGAASWPTRARRRRLAGIVLAVGLTSDDDPVDRRTRQLQGESIRSRRQTAALRRPS